MLHICSRLILANNIIQGIYQLGSIGKNLFHHHHIVTGTGNPITFHSSAGQGHYLSCELQEVVLCVQALIS